MEPSQRKLYTKAALHTVTAARRLHSATDYRTVSIPPTPAQGKSKLILVGKSDGSEGWGQTLRGSECFHDVPGPLAIMFASTYAQSGSLSALFVKYQETLGCSGLGFELWVFVISLSIRKLNAQTPATLCARCYYADMS